MKTLLDAGAAVMDLVRVKDDGVASTTVGAGAAVIKGLDAAYGEAQRIGVVAMRVIGVAGKVGFNALDAGFGRGSAKPILGLWPARSFKTGLYFTV